MTVESRHFETTKELTTEEATIEFFKRCKPVIIATARALGYEWLYPESISFPTRLHLQFRRSETSCSVECYPKGEVGTGTSWWGFRCAPAYRQDHSELERAIEATLLRAKIFSPTWHSQGIWG